MIGLNNVQLFIKIVNVTAKPVGRLGLCLNIREISSVLQNPARLTLFRFVFNSLLKATRAEGRRHCLLHIFGLNDVNLIRVSCIKTGAFYLLKSVLVWFMYVK